jgi:hypothetical protein
MRKLMVGTQAAADVSEFKWREAGLLSPAPNQSVFSPPTPSSLANSRKFNPAQLFIDF